MEPITELPSELNSNDPRTPKEKLFSPEAKLISQKNLTDNVFVLESLIFGGYSKESRS